MALQKRARSVDDSDDAPLFPSSSSPIKRQRRDSDWSTTSSQYTPYPPQPLDSPSNPFGQKHARSKIHKLPPVTLFGKYVSLRFQFVRKGLGPRLGGVHRVVQVPLNYSFTHLRGLIAFLFDSNVRYHGRRGLTGGFGLQDEYLFEVMNKVMMYSPLYKPGQIKSGNTTVKLSNVRDPCRWRGRGLVGGFGDEEEEDELEDELDEDEDMNGLDPDADMLEEDENTPPGEDDLEEKPGKWRWEDEEHYTLGHIWSKGLDIERGIIYHHSRTTQIHITINSLTDLPTRTGKSNQPYVFIARGRMNLSPAPLPPPKFSTSPEKPSLFPSSSSNIAKPTPLPTSTTAKPTSKTTLPAIRAESVELDENVFLAHDNDSNEGDAEDDLTTTNSYIEDPNFMFDPAKWNDPEGKFGSYFLEFMGCPKGAVVEDDDGAVAEDPFANDDDDDDVVMSKEKPKRKKTPSARVSMGRIDADSEDEEEQEGEDGEGDEEGDEQEGDDEEGEGEEDGEDDGYTSGDSEEDEEEWEDDARSHPTSSPVRHLSPSPAKERPSLFGLPSSSPPAYTIELDDIEDSSPQKHGPTSSHDPDEENDVEPEPEGPSLSSSPRKPTTYFHTLSASLSPPEIIPTEAEPSQQRTKRPRLRRNSNPIFPNPTDPTTASDTTFPIPGPDAGTRTAFSSPGPLVEDLPSASGSSPTQDEDATDPGPSSSYHPRSSFSSPPPLPLLSQLFDLSQHYPNPKYTETPIPKMGKAMRVRLRRVQRRIKFAAGNGWKRVEEAEEREEEREREKRRKAVEKQREMEREAEEEQEEEDEEDKENVSIATIEEGNEEEGEENSESTKILDAKRTRMLKLYNIFGREFKQGIMSGKKVWKRRFERAGVEYLGWGLDEDEDNDDNEDEEDQLASDDEGDENDENEEGEEEAGEDDDEEYHSDAESVEL